MNQQLKQELEDNLKRLREAIRSIHELGLCFEALLSDSCSVELLDEIEAQQNLLASITLHSVSGPLSSSEELLVMRFLNKLRFLLLGCQDWVKRHPGCALQNLTQWLASDPDAGSISQKLDKFLLDAQRQVYDASVLANNSASLRLKDSDIIRKFRKRNTTKKLSKTNLRAVAESLERFKKQVNDNNVKAKQPSSLISVNSKINLQSPFQPKQSHGRIQKPDFKLKALATGNRKSSQTKNAETEPVKQKSKSMVTQLMTKVTSNSRSRYLLCRDRPAGQSFKLVKKRLVKQGLRHAVVVQDLDMNQSMVPIHFRTQIHELRQQISLVGIF